MMPPAGNRRAFFGQMSSGCGFGLALAQTPPPEKAWLIVALGWQYDDQSTYQEGERPQGHVYYDKMQADAACQSLCDEFYNDQTPEEFEIDWAFYFPDGVDDLSEVTWDAVREAGFPEPFYVLELTYEPTSKGHRDE